MGKEHRIEGTLSPIGPGKGMTEEGKGKGECNMKLEEK